MDVRHASALKPGSRHRSEARSDDAQCLVAPSDPPLGQVRTRQRARHEHRGPPLRPESIPRRCDQKGRHTMALTRRQFTLGALASTALTTTGL
ncbi:hypothetical protein ACFYUR_23950, partial [Micromonospora haikouensis]|uniref:hypothetical protein n=1 Tax=Micromonospora haikouensis TaxID=686309 RepID=UPI0036BE0CEA